VTQCSLKQWAESIGISTACYVSPVRFEQNWQAAQPQQANS
jgi:hypothetical protein